MDDSSLRQGALAGALRQVMNQLARLLEETDPTPLLREGGSLRASLAEWRRVAAAGMGDPAADRVRELEQSRLALQGRVAMADKEATDLRQRNADLLGEIIRLNQRVDEAKKTHLEAQLATNSARADARRLDLEVRDLRRRVQELEGGPPLTPAEAAPRSSAATVEPSIPAAVTAAPSMLTPSTPSTAPGPTAPPPTAVIAPVAELALRDDRATAGAVADKPAPRRAARRGTGGATGHRTTATTERTPTPAQPRARTKPAVGGPRAGVPAPEGQARAPERARNKHTAEKKRPAANKDKTKAAKNKTPARAPAARQAAAATRGARARRKAR